jgi:D-alanyl-D-alanine carboxypeptidase
MRARLRWAASLVTVAAVGSLVLGQAPVEPSPAPSGRTSIEMVAATKVELLRRKGFVEGDGRTVYVANGTEFRPRRTVVVVPPRVRARSWAVVDLATGRLLGKHRARTQLPQASTMTAGLPVLALAPYAAARLVRGLGGRR